MPTYEIKPGDSIFKISKNTGVPPEEIISLNNIKNNRIFAGQKLNLPYIRTPEEQRQIRLDEFLNREITNEERALLDAISFAEGTKGYGTIFGRKEIPGIGKGDYTIQEIIDMSLSRKYPDGTEVGYGKFKDKKTGKILSSGATGRYQFMGKTLKDLVANQLGLPSLLSEKFTPEMQDRLILKLLSSSYGITPESLKGGLTTQLVNKLSAPFASFPTEEGVSRYGQPVKPVQDIIDNYIKALGVYGPQPINTSTSRWIVG